MFLSLGSSSALLPASMTSLASQRSVALGMSHKGDVPFFEIRGGRRVSGGSSYLPPRGEGRGETTRRATWPGEHIVQTSVGHLVVFVFVCIPEDVSAPQPVCLFYSLLGIRTSLLWASKPWGFTLPTSMFEWIRWHMCCITLRNPL